LAEASKDEKQIVIKIIKPIPCSGFLAEGEIVALFSTGEKLSFSE
jgi:ATP-dependent DNA ligase